MNTLRVGSHRFTAYAHEREASQRERENKWRKTENIDDNKIDESRVKNMRVMILDLIEKQTNEMKPIVSHERMGKRADIKNRLFLPKEPFFIHRKFNYSRCFLFCAIGDWWGICLWKDSFYFSYFMVPSFPRTGNYTIASTSVYNTLPLPFGVKCDWVDRART